MMPTMFCTYVKCMEPDTCNITGYEPGDIVSVTKFPVGTGPTKVLSVKSRLKRKKSPSIVLDIDDAIALGLDVDPVNGSGPTDVVFVEKCKNKKEDI